MTVNGQTPCATTDDATQPGPRRRPDPERNLILRWLREQRRAAPGEYLDHLLRLDVSLCQGLKGLYSGGDRASRLALALFIDFAQHSSLNVGELALLLADARDDSIEALRHMLEAAERAATEG